MKWEEVRETCPNKFVKLQILEYHLDGSKKIIDDMAVIKVLDDNKSATKELMNCKEGTVVYHTANESIYVEVKNIRAYRGLEAIVKVKPQTVEALKEINGFGNVKCEKYGEGIVEIVKRNL